MLKINDSNDVKLYNLKKLSSNVFIFLIIEFISSIKLKEYQEYVSFNSFTSINSLIK